MPTINFSIPQTLDQQVKTVVQKKGFVSKAEFLRFTVRNYLDKLEEIQTLPLDNDPEIVSLCNQIEQAFNEKIGDRPLPSIEEQLDRIKDL